MSTLRIRFVNTQTPGLRELFVLENDKLWYQAAYAKGDGILVDIPVPKCGYLSIVLEPMPPEETLSPTKNSC